jgi:hypothetical protein
MVHEPAFRRLSAVADNDVPEEAPALWPRLRVLDGGKSEAPVA